MKLIYLITSVILFAGVTACSSQDLGVNSNDSQSASDGTSADDIPSLTTGKNWSFVGETVTNTTTPVVFLELESLVETSARLRVVGKEIPKLHGIAFRLQSSSSEVVLKSGERGPAWPAGESTVVAFKARPNDRQLWAGIAHIGPKTFPAIERTILAYVDLELPHASNTTVANAVAITFPSIGVWITGDQVKPVEATWLGGKFQR